MCEEHTLKRRESFNKKKTRSTDNEARTFTVVNYKKQALNLLRFKCKTGDPETFRNHFRGNISRIVMGEGFIRTFSPQNMGNSRKRNHVKLRKLHAKTEQRGLPE